ncbi:FAD-dependent oxidoreductase [Aquirufa sp. TARAVU-A1A]
MRYIICFLLLASTCFGQKVQSFDVIVYGATPAGVMAAYAAKAAGKKTLLIDASTTLPYAQQGFGMKFELNPAQIHGLPRDFFRKVGGKLGKFQAFEFDSSTGYEVLQSYLDDAKIVVWPGHQVIASLVEGNEVKQLSLQAEEGVKLVKAKSYIDCSYNGDMLLKTGYQATKELEEDGMGGSTSRLIYAEPTWTNMQAPVLIAGKGVDVINMQLGQSAAIKAVESILRDIPVAKISSEEVERYYKYNPWMDGSRPELIVDDAEAANMEIIGHWNKIKNQPGTFGGTYLQTNPLDDLGSRIRFTSKTPLKGDYQLYYYIPAVRGGTTVINLEVYVAKVRHVASVHIAPDTTETWVPVGTYHFEDNTTGDVLVSQRGANGLLVADAVLWLPKNK